MMANGGVIAPVGMNMVALAAQKHAVPFVVVAGIHKVSELYWLFHVFNCQKGLIKGREKKDRNLVRYQTCAVQPFKWLLLLTLNNTQFLCILLIVTPELEGI